MGRRVVLVPQSADGSPRSHASSSVEADAFDRHSHSTASGQEASSDTEISDVSKDGGSISEEEADPSVVEVSMGPVLRDALRWLDTVDLTGILSLGMRHVITSTFLSGGYRAAMRLALKRLQMVWSAMTKSHSVAGGSSSFCVATIVVVQTTTGWFDPLTRTREQIQRILPWRMGPVVVPVRGVGRSCFQGFPTEVESTDGHSRTRAERAESPQVAMRWRELLWHPAFNGRWTSCATQ